MEKLSKNFTREEFACKGELCCGHSAPVAFELVDGLQALRDIVGKPVKVLSGFRCRTHNTSISENEDSYHTKALAADIAVKGMTGEDLAHYATQVKLFFHGGIGIYPNRIHVDVRKDGPARWGGSK